MNGFSYFIYFILVFIFISFHFVFKTISNEKENDRKSKPSVLNEINLKVKSIESK